MKRLFIGLAIVLCLSSVAIGQTCNCSLLTATAAQIALRLGIPHGSTPSTSGQTVGNIFLDTDDGSFLYWNGSAWIGILAASGAPTGTAGGDLAGTYPNPTVDGITLGSDAQGDMYYRGAAGLARLAAGTSGHVLTTAGAGANPAWAAPAAGYTDEQAQDAVGAMVDGSLTYVDASPLLQRAALTGDVTASAGSNATTIAASAVTLAKMANIATASFVGRTTAGAGVPEVLTATQATAILNAMIGDSGSGGTKGLVPAPASGDAAKVLSGAGTWITAGGGGHAVQDEGTPLTARANLNFTGPGVTATDSAGTSATIVNVPGVLHSASTTAVGNIGSGTDDLMVYSLPAATLGTNGDTVEIVAWGGFAANANAKQLVCLFGATTLFDTTSLAMNGGDWVVKAQVTRTGAATQKAAAVFSSSLNTLASSALYSTPTETLSGAVTIKCTGAATADNDIVQQGLDVRLPSVGSVAGGGSTISQGVYASRPAAASSGNTYYATDLPIVSVDTGSAWNAYVHDRKYADPTPIAIPGLAVWLDASQLTGFSDTDPVPTWANMVHAGGNAVSTATNVPTYRTSVVNSLPVVRFNGAGFYYLRAPFDDASFSWFAVLKITSLANAYTGAIGFGWDTDDGGYFIKSNGKTALYVPGNVYDGTGAVTLNNSTFYVLSGVAGPSSLSTRVALAADVTGATWTSITGSAQSKILLGNQAIASRFFTGDMAEVLIYRRALNSTDRDTVENYLKTKYGL